MATRSASGRRQVPFVDLRTPHRALRAEILDAIGAALDSAAFAGGPAVESFERDFATYIETPHAVGLGSGTDALRLAYLAMGIQPGDEVITVPNTFIATTEALSQARATIRFVDVDQQTSNLDVEQLSTAIGPRTVGIVPVHLYGQPADLDAISDVGGSHGLWIVEDAAQAQGSRYKGRRVGSHGDVAAFSFYPGKNLGACGEAGAITTKHAAVAERIKMLRDHGQRAKYYHEVEGYNARLDAWQAAVLRIKLHHLDEWNAARRRAAEYYRASLADLEMIRLPYEPEWAEGNYHLFVIHADRRDELRDHLTKAGIASGLHYPLPLHLQPAYAHLRLRRGTFPVSERLAQRLLSLPMYPDITQVDCEYVAERIREFYGA